MNLTEFALTTKNDNKTFWIPGDYDSNEYLYTTSKVSEIDATVLVNDPNRYSCTVLCPDRYGIQTPLMMKTADGLYINIHEAALQNYTSMQLHVDIKTFKLTASLVPDAVEQQSLYSSLVAYAMAYHALCNPTKRRKYSPSKLILNLPDDRSKIEIRRG